MPALADFMLTPEAQTHFNGLGMQPTTGTPGEAHAYIRQRSGALDRDHQGHRRERGLRLDWLQRMQEGGCTCASLTIGLVVPFATDKVPAEGPLMYPDVTFIPRGVGVRALTPEAMTRPGTAFFRRPRNSPSRASMPSW